MKYRVGFDIGGTKIKVVALDYKGIVVYDKSIATQFSPEAIYNDIANLYQDTLHAIDFVHHSIGVGLPGTSVRPTYLFEGTNIPTELFDRFNRVCKIENDANCFTLAEANLGAGHNAHSVFGVILGTGVGGGIAIEGRLYKGHSGLAGEWGHVPLYHDGLLCWCGGQGCSEQYLSGRAIEKKYTRNTNNPGVDADTILSTNDLVNFAIRHEFYNDLAQGLANIINYYDPEVIVIGGGLSNHNEIYDVIPKKVEELIFNKELRTRIVKSDLGSQAGAIGAALL